MPENVSSVPVGFLWAAVLFGLLAVVGGGIKVGIIQIHGMLGPDQRRKAGLASVWLFVAAFCSLLIGPLTTLLSHRPDDVRPQGDQAPVSSGSPKSAEAPSAETTSGVAPMNGGVTSVSRVEIGVGGQEAVRGAGGDLGALADTAHVNCQRGAEQSIETRLVGYEAVLWEAPTRDSARVLAEGFQSRLRDAGFRPQDYSENTLEGSFHNANHTVRGGMWSSEDGRAWMWIACKIGPINR